MKNKISVDKLLGIINGAVIGDIIGVPFEFSPKISATYGDKLVKSNDKTLFNKGGMHDQPRYSWSDDTSLILATIDSMNKMNGEINREDIMNKFSDFLFKGKYTSHGDVFDVGIRTERAIKDYVNYSTLCEKLDEDELGNGTLMRISPALLTKDPICSAGELVKLTHNNSTSIIICQMFIKILINLSAHMDDFTLGHEETVKIAIISDIINEAISEYKPKLSSEYQSQIPNNVIEIMEMFKDEKPYSTGFIIDSLLVAIYSIISTDSFDESIIEAVNTCGDTDTNACITGMLAGAIYGIKGIPDKLMAPLWSKHSPVSTKFKALIIRMVQNYCESTDDSVKALSELNIRGDRGWINLR